MPNRINVQERERAEIRRSAGEAAHLDVGGAPGFEALLARYADPPADTCFPLEYSFHLLGDVRGKTVLDLGCGAGENALLLAQRGAKVYATDISEPLLRIAQLRLAAHGVEKDVLFFAGSAHDLPLADGSIDVVFGIAILHHLDLDLVRRELRRVLREGGRAIFQEPIRNSPVLRSLRRLIPYRDPDLSPFERPLTDRELASFAHGCAPGRSRAFALPYINLAGILPIVRDRVEPLYRLDRALLQRIPPLRHYAGVRVFELIKEDFCPADSGRDLVPI